MSNFTKLSFLGLFDSNFLMFIYINTCRGLGDLNTNRLDEISFWSDLSGSLIGVELAHFLRSNNRDKITFLDSPRDSNRFRQSAISPQIYFTMVIFWKTLLYIIKKKDPLKVTLLIFFVFNPEKIIHGIPLSRNDPLGLNYLIIFFSQTIWSTLLKKVLF